jgi:hypothetical protein
MGAALLTPFDSPTLGAMAYHTLKKFKRKELRDEIDMLMAEQLNAVVRGDATSHDAREAFFQAIDGRFGKRGKLKQRKAFQRGLLLTVLGGVPDPSEDDLGLALGYLRKRIVKGSLSLPEAKERLARAVHLLDPEHQRQWMHELEGEVLGRREVAQPPAFPRKEQRA